MAVIILVRVSATGGLKESRSRYISYNIMKYDIQEKKMKLCMIF